MDFEIFKESAQRYNPILLEKLDMTLEEIFYSKWEAIIMSSKSLFNTTLIKKI